MVIILVPRAKHRTIARFIAAPPPLLAVLPRSTTAPAFTGGPRRQAERELGASAP